MGNKGKIAAGIGLGCLLALICVALGAFFVMRSMKRTIDTATFKDQRVLQNSWTPPVSLAPDAGLAPKTVGDATLSKYTISFGINAPGYEMIYLRNGQTWTVRVFDAKDVPDYLRLVHHKHIDRAKSLPEPKGYVHFTDPATGVRSLRYHSSKESGHIFNGGGKTVHAFVPANEQVFPWLQQYLETTDGS